MTDTDALAQALAPRIADLLRPYVVKDALWSRKEIEGYSGFGRSTVATFMASPIFPRAVRIGKGDPR